MLVICSYNTGYWHIRRNMFIQCYYWEIKRKWFFCCPKEVPWFSFVEQSSAPIFATVCWASRTHFSQQPFFCKSSVLLDPRPHLYVRVVRVGRTREFSNCLLREWMVLASCKLDWGEKPPNLYNGKCYSLRLMGQLVTKVPLASHILELSTLHRWLISSSYHQNVDHTLTSTGYYLTTFTFYNKVHWFFFFFFHPPWIIHFQLLRSSTGGQKSRTAVGSDSRVKVIKTRNRKAGIKLLPTGKPNSRGVKSSLSVFVEFILCTFSIKCKMRAVWVGVRW